MAHVIDETCASCGICLEVCPLQAIYRGPEHCEIDANVCCDCGECEISCPNNSIKEG